MTHYYVETWDTDRQRFTPQQGVRKGPYSQFGLRKALRKLEGCGYERMGPSVMIYSRSRAKPQAAGSVP